MGRHAASGSDGLGPGDAPVSGGRRRTDTPGGLWGGTSADGLSDHPAGSGRNRAEALRAPVAGVDVAQRIPRSRLPLPPVPAAPGGPRTSAAPFRAVPTPELPGGPTGDGRASAPADPAARMTGNGVTPVLPRPARSWPDEEPALVSTGPGLTASGSRASGPAPRLPRQTSPAAAPSPAYGDWTKPSRSSEPLDMDFSAGHLDMRMPVAPVTTAIPERPINRGQRTADGAEFDSAAFDRAEYDSAEFDRVRFQRAGFDRAEFDRAEFDSAEFDAPFSDAYPARGAGSGPTTGPGQGRAAMRAQRQAVDMARRKAAKRNGEPVGLPEDEEGAARRPRRVLMGLVAMAVVALAVLGVYTVVSPGTEEAGAGSEATQSSAPGAATSTAVLPPLQTEELEIGGTSEAPAAPVLAPVTVLNATDVNGLAAQVSEAIAGGGWETPAVGTYLADDIAVTTVFYAKGDDTQRQAAESLKAQFPQVQAVGERAFEVPADVAAPGIVVVVAAEWQP